MTHLKFFCGLTLATSLFHSACTTTQTEVVVGKAPSPPIVEPEPEPEPIPDSEIVEVEPDIPELPLEPPEAIKDLFVPEEPEPESLIILGLIKYVELDGGFFGIMTEDGAKYFPEYLKPDFKQDGLNVRAVALPQEQILGIQMWGTPIEILKIEAN